ncbi:hypothetical protein TSUD_364080 [Trifolium subterraneum]|uniref:F-box domain-containing protein n=1 Tax=Trifolium subterraneum TaxID=3900 RepID=A0A2Z6NFP1_TRISU|nr:hypothetical protein TSUD_364080 [Trifolium subterraneum]
MTELGELPEGCIAVILSRTTPLDVGRLSLVSTTFNSAAKFNDVWNRFLPSDPHLISSTISQCPSLANNPSKKALFLAMSDSPIIIDNGRKSFQLERKSGKKCYMLSARSLTIAGIDDIYSWYWTDTPDSRFTEVANIRFLRWLEIRGMINTTSLSPNTQYAAYLVFKTIHAYGFDKCPVVLSVGVEGGHIDTKIVCLDPNVQRRPSNRRFNHTLVGLPRPSVRSDGWLEIEMGEFFNSGIEDENIQMNVIEIMSGMMKASFSLEGIEVRPKVDN